MHHADAVGDGIGRRAMADRSAADNNLPLVGLGKPEQDIHQRRLACAVFTDEGVDLALVEGEIHRSVGGNPVREPLCNSLEKNERFPSVSHSRRYSFTLTVPSPMPLNTSMTRSSTSGGTCWKGRFKVKSPVLMFSWTIWPSSVPWVNASPISSYAPM